MSRLFMLIGNSNGLNFKVVEKVQEENWNIRCLVTNDWTV